MDIDSKDEESPRKRFQMNTSTPSFPDDKCLSSDTPPTLDSNMETDDMEYKSDIDTAAPDALPTRYLTTKIFNTTSSVFASETIASPDVHQILFW